jgi:hypothetical protein
MPTINVAPTAMEAASSDLMKVSSPSRIGETQFVRDANNPETSERCQLQFSAC